MKKNFLWMFTAIMTLCGATMFSACSSDKDDTPVTPATDDVRLTKIAMVTLSSEGDTLVASTQSLTWENGLLTKTNTVMRTPTMDLILEQEDRYVYEGTNCTEIHYDTGTDEYFTYDGGRLRSAVSTMSGGYTMRINVTGYTDDGHISEMTKETIDEGGTRIKVNYTFTWTDGDLTAWGSHPVDPAGEDDLITYSYLDLPSPFIGYPVAQYILSPFETANRGSKHFFDDDEELTTENGRVTMAKHDNTTTYYAYSDGTGSNTFPD